MTFYNNFNVNCPELASSTISLSGDRAQGDHSKHCAYSTQHAELICTLTTKSVDPNKMPQRVASHQALQCLLR